jgi:hypothetical protein
MAKPTFFDDKAITGKLDPAIAKALSKLGAFSRQSARSSLRYASKPHQSARPGNPPLVHRSTKFTRKKKSKGVFKAQPVSPLRELIYFGLEKETNYQNMVVGPILGGSKSGAPEKLEHGKFPFMAPAGELALGELPNLFTNCVS